MTGMALRLFDDIYPDAPATEGIKYTGSKRKLLPQILHLIDKVHAKTVLDGFSGSTRVSQALAKTGHRVISNDIAVWSQVFGQCYLQGLTQRHYADLLAYLNAVEARDGWFTEHYGGQPSDRMPKKPWQIHNTRKLDGIREEIDRLPLSEVERAVALTSLILALDRVDSTLGHYASYLRDWSPRSYAPLQLRIPQITPGNGEHRVLRNDIFDVAGATEADLAYYDPPYGSNNEKMPPSRVRYAAYYHIWTTICLNDRPDLFGKAKRRVDTRDTASPSVFEEFKQNSSGRFIAVAAVERLIAQTRAPFILLSYSSGGRATATELHDAIASHGRVLEAVEIDYKQNVMAGMSWTNEWLRNAKAPHQEFLFLIEKRG